MVRFSFTSLLVVAVALSMAVAGHPSLDFGTQKADGWVHAEPCCPDGRTGDPGRSEAPCECPSEPAPGVIGRLMHPPAKCVGWLHVALPDRPESAVLAPRRPVPIA